MSQCAGVRTRLFGFEMRLSYSRKKFLVFFPAQNTQAFLEGHARAFDHFAGVPQRITYDNTTLAVVRVGKGKERKLTKNFLNLQGHFAFTPNFCQPGIDGAHEKGGIEGSIKYSRQNWFVPVPKFGSIEELNEFARAKCLEDDARQVSGQPTTIAVAFEAERDKLLKLPRHRFDTGVPKHSCIVDAFQTLIFDKIRYSVPAAFCGKPLALRAYWDRVKITWKGELVAEHRRGTLDGEYVLSPEHYFDQLERKPHAVGYARPLLQADWPAEYWQYYRDVCKRGGPSEGGRDFIRLLRLHTKLGRAVLCSAIQEARQSGALNVDVITAITDRTIHGAAPPVVPLSLEDKEHLQHYTVSILQTDEYQALLEEKRDGEYVA